MKVKSGSDESWISSFMVEGTQMMDATCTIGPQEMKDATALSEGHVILIRYLDTTARVSLNPSKNKG